MEKLINWLAYSFAIAVFLALITGIYFPLIHIDQWSEEPRSKLVIALDHGALFWGTLSLIFLIASTALFAVKKYIRLLLTVVLFLSTGFIFYLSIHNLEPYYKDVAVFQNKHDIKENLIIQYYETGVTGNPNRRIIKTRNINAAIREYESIPIPPFLDTLYFYKKGFEQSIPKVYISRQDTFILREVVSPFK